MPEINTAFVQLPVSDVQKSREFFAGLGFEFDDMFSGENAACVMVGEKSRLMLMSTGFFTNLIPGKQIADTSAATEAIVSFNLPDRAAVDAFIASAIAGGGSAYRETMDMGGMYVRAVQDPDGHVLEVFAMATG